MKEIKELIKNEDVRFDFQNCDDLVRAFDLEASVISSKAKMLSTLNREESRGSNQRSDFPELDNLKECSYLVKLNNQHLEQDISKKDILL